MGKTILIIWFVAVCPFMAFSESEMSEIVMSADSAYAAEDYQQAIAGYEHALSQGVSSSELYYNLGNAFYREGRLGKSVISYERSLKLDPSNDDARVNLQFVKSKLVDRQQQDNNMVSIFFQSIRDSFTSNTWAWISITLFALFIGLLAAYFFTTPVLIRKIGFFGSFAALALSVFAIAMAIDNASLATSRNDGVVISPSVMLGTAPRTPKDRNEEVALLHEGTKIEIIDSLVTRTDSLQTKWYKVKLPSSHQGWTSAKGIELI